MEKGAVAEENKAFTFKGRNASWTLTSRVLNLKTESQVQLNGVRYGSTLRSCQSMASTLRLASRCNQIQVSLFQGLFLS